MDDTALPTVVELAALVRAGQASPYEVVERALRRIEVLDGPLHAFAFVDGERALADAAALQPGSAQPFAGVPLAVKAGTAVRGMPAHHGSRFLEDYRPRHSAYLVRRARAAGFVVVGLTSMPEFGILPTTEPRHGGATRNPWNPGRTPGGSSGGSAAAVATGMVPVAHGSDGGGSLRIPAACCGLVGLKPSRGRISHGPELGDSFLSTDGVLTRTVADTALLLDVLAGYEVGDATWAPRPPERYASAARRDPGRLRVAVSTANPLGVAPDPEHVQALRATADALTELGHDVRDADPRLPTEPVLELFFEAFAALVSLPIAFGERWRGRPPGPEDIEPLSRAVYERAQGTSSVCYLRRVAQLQALARGLVAFFADYDLLLTPALAERPLAIGECTGFGEDPSAALERAARFTPYTALWNLTGQPAISLPAGLSDADGIPTAVQIVGKPLAEDTLMQVAAQLERARPWAHRSPGV